MIRHQSTVYKLTLHLTVTYWLDISFCRCKTPQLSSLYCLYYFVSASIATPLSQVTASSTIECRKPSAEPVSGHDSTMCFIICDWPPEHLSHDAIAIRKHSSGIFKKYLVHILGLQHINVYVLHHITHKHKSKTENM